MSILVERTPLIIERVYIIMLGTTIIVDGNSIVVLRLPIFLERPSLFAWQQRLAKSWMHFVAQCLHHLQSRLRVFQVRNAPLVGQLDHSLRLVSRYGDDGTPFAGCVAEVNDL
jgi:hypothetical protein